MSGTSAAFGSRGLPCRFSEGVLGPGFLGGTLEGEVAKVCLNLYMGSLRSQHAPLFSFRQVCFAGRPFSKTCCLFQTTAGAQVRGIPKASDIKKKFLVRWANTARSKAETCNDEKKEQYEQAAKRLQIMESSIKLHRAWVFRSGCQEKAWADFEHQWQLLIQFAASTPVQIIRCDFLWELRLQILVTLPLLLFCWALNNWCVCVCVPRLEGSEPVQERPPPGTAG